MPVTGGDCPKGGAHESTTEAAVATAARGAQVWQCRKCKRLFGMG